MRGFLRKQKREDQELVGIASTNGGLGLAVVRRGGDNLKLKVHQLQGPESAGSGRLKEQAKRLGDTVEARGLKAARCNFVLDSEDYKLLLVESPKVEESEMAAAIRWRIKDLIDRPIDEVAVDIFPVPADAYRGQGDMVYAVAARRKRIIEIRDMVEEAGLILESIDIPELAMRNLTSIYTDDSDGLAFIDLRSTGSTLNLSRGGSIYLTRYLSTRLDASIMQSPEWEDVKERLVLEIQRSLDYYESQMAQSPISRLLVAPRSEDSEALAAELNEAMAVRVETMDLSSRVDTDDRLTPEVQHRCLLAIGAALRGQEAVS